MRRPRRFTRTETLLPVQTRVRSVLPLGGGVGERAGAAIHANESSLTDLFGDQRLHVALRPRAVVRDDIGGADRAATERLFEIMALCLPVEEARPAQQARAGGVNHRVDRVRRHLPTGVADNRVRPPLTCTG